MNLSLTNGRSFNVQVSICKMCLRINHQRVSLTAESLSGNHFGIFSNFDFIEINFRNLKIKFNFCNF